MVTSVRKISPKPSLILLRRELLHQVTKHHTILDLVNSPQYKVARHMQLDIKVASSTEQDTLSLARLLTSQEDHNHSTIITQATITKLTTLNSTSLHSQFELLD